MFPSGMAIQDLAIFTMLDVFVVLPSFTLSRSCYSSFFFWRWAYCYGCIYGCIVRMHCSCGMQY